MVTPRIIESGYLLYDFHQYHINTIIEGPCHTKIGNVGICYTKIMNYLWRQWASHGSEKSKPASGTNHYMYSVTW